MYLFWAMVYAARVPVISTVLAVVALTVPPQTRDMMDYLLSDNWVRWLFQVSLVVLAASAWYWARAALNARYEIQYQSMSDSVDKQLFDKPLALLWETGDADDAQRQEVLKRLETDKRIAKRLFLWLPRTLYIAIMLSGTKAAAFGSASAAFLSFVWMLAPFGVAYVWRSDSIARYANVYLQRDNVRIYVQDLYTAPFYKLRKFAPFPLYNILFWTMFCIGILPLLVFGVELILPLGGNDYDYAVAFARWFPMPATALLLFSTLVGLFTVLAAFFSSQRLPLPRSIGRLLPDHWDNQFPVPVGAIVLVIAFSSSIYGHLHPVRTLLPQPESHTSIGLVAVVVALLMAGLVLCVFTRGRWRVAVAGFAGFAVIAFALTLPEIWPELRPALSQLGLQSAQASQRYPQARRDPKAGFDPTEREHIGDFLQQWAKDCGPQTDDLHGPLRPVIVAISGGASRAGLWAARSLWSIDHQLAWLDTGKRENRTASQPAIFAISSVSGGSLGAAAYMALRAANTDTDVRCYLPQARDDDAYTHRLDRALIDATERVLIDATAADALGPDVAGVYRDFVRSLLFVFEKIGIQLPRSMLERDRTTALEVAFEQNWRRALELQKLVRSFEFNQSYLSLNYYYDGGGSPTLRSGMPIWIGNGTDTQNVWPVLTVPFQSDKSDLRRTWPFSGARDALALIGSDVRISTAITNTARFPFISPEGELGAPSTARPGEDGYASLPTQLTDGGYFDNSGLETARELANWLQENGPSFINGREIDPIIVAVTADSDPAITPANVIRCGSGPDRNPEQSGGRKKSNDIWEELWALNMARSTHSEVALLQVSDDFCHAPGKPEDTSHPRFFHLYLHGNRGAEIPMNWLVSERTADFIWNDADKDDDNERELHRLHREAVTSRTDHMLNLYLPIQAAVHSGIP